MSIFRFSAGALGALMLLVTPNSAMAAEAAPSADARPNQPPADDVPAPPMALLFGIGAVGILWGRRLAAGARKKQEAARPD